MHREVAGPGLQADGPPPSDDQLREVLLALHPTGGRPLCRPVSARLPVWPATREPCPAPVHGPSRITFGVDVEGRRQPRLRPNRPRRARRTRRLRGPRQQTQLRSEPGDISPAVDTTIPTRNADAPNGHFRGAKSRVRLPSLRSALRGLDTRLGAPDYLGNYRNVGAVDRQAEGG